MNRKLATILAIILIVLGLIGYGSFFSVHETRQALVLQFGNPVKTVQAPGLNFKVPFVQNVQFMEKRILDFDAPPVEAVAADKKRIVVDAYARFRIADPLKFYQTVNNEVTARNRLAPIVNSSLRNAIGRVKLEQMLSGERGKLMHEIRGLVNTEALKLGIEIVDVRIKRADLPAANSQAVYDLMRAERKRIATEIRAEGAERSQKITANADRERTILLAEAQKSSQIIRGEGDALRNKIFADAYKEDAEFFTFYRSLQAYRTALQSGDTTMVLSPNSDFFSYFGNSRGAIKK
ncbi:MAG: protease modulator HflC [Alphaproteobacteria bacterium]|jgi:membrane protease subunit HflC|nr:protease modulator HflC [Alphaproteobacteria bacterium]MDP7461342.1 protease modulator HflC [Alphaproteobacteria bacterium]HJM91201.1 protease modulator HflC [Alphaproteobacteria bacterium]